MRKKKTISRGISIVLAAAMVLAGQPLFAYGAASLAELKSSSIVINEQMTLHQGIYFNSASSANAAENYLVYEPGAKITPFISYGNDVYGAAGVSRIYEIEEEKGRRIVAATNGDYFTMATGVSLGTVIRDGVLRTGEHSSFETVGFDEEGNAMIGRLNLSVNVQDQNTGSSLKGIGFNKTMSQSNGVILYTEDFGDTNEAGFPTKNVIIDLESGIAAPGESIVGTISQKVDATGKLALEEDRLVLSLSSASPYVSAMAAMDAMQVGDTVVIDFTTDEKWHGVAQAVGAEKRLITDGQIPAFTDTGRAPRTAIGVRDDGSVVLYTVDGRQSDYSMGMTYAELAERMQDLGCRDAVNLDGGDSTIDRKSTRLNSSHRT